MSKSITVKEGATAKNFTGVKKISTNQMGGGSVSWIPEDEAADYCTFKKITARENGTYKAEDNACDGFSEVKVEVPADVKDKVITTNGEYIAAEDNCLGYRKVTVNVSGGGSGSGQHTVIFYAADRTTILERVIVEDGGGASYHGATPVSPGMRFIGWSPNPWNVKADMNVYPKFENYIYDPTEIVEDWMTIARNIRTNPDYYKIGQWKYIEFNALPKEEWDEISDLMFTNSNYSDDVPVTIAKATLIAKGVDVLEGDNGYASTTWVVSPVFYANTIVGIPTTFYLSHNDATYHLCWKRSMIRAFLQSQFTSKMFPQDLLAYVRRVVKYSTEKEVSGYVSVITSKSDPTIDWFFVPSLREIAGACTDADTAIISGTGQTIAGNMETTGAIYDYFATVNGVPVDYATAVSKRIELQNNINTVISTRTGIAGSPANRGLALNVSGNFYVDNYNVRDIYYHPICFCL